MAPEPSEARVVEEHDVGVPGEAQVELKGVGTFADRGAQRREGVFAVDEGVATVRDREEHGFSLRREAGPEPNALNTIWRSVHEIS
ncbi:hypothetical protein GCM10023075_66340 [Streptosporangium album]